jgi:PhnB protein
MTNATNRTTNDRQTVRLFLCAKNAEEAIEFYKKAFGADELTRSAGSDGRIGRAEVQIGNSRLLIADEFPEAPEMKGVRSPLSLGGSSMHICLEVEDVDSCFNQAVAAGAKPLMPVKGKPQGGRRARLTDPFGHVWTLSSGSD